MACERGLLPLRVPRWIDLPPIWLAGFCALAWGQARVYPLNLEFPGAWVDLLGGLCVGGGIVLMALAFYEMRRQRTTVIPHREASQLVITGIFSRTRNPIYLGDTLVLTGLILYWDAVLALPLIPIFVWVIEKRVIVPEEDRLRRKFRLEFARYVEKVRRWV